MKILDRTKMAVISVICMAVIAGYLNYKYDPERERDLGQTVYVNSKDAYTYDKVNIYSDDVENKEATKINTTNIQDTSDSIATFRYDRDNMFSELSENYTNIINNKNTDAKKVNEYQEKLDELISEKNLITMVENVIKSTGVEDIVIIPTSNENINVVIKQEEELSKEQVAKIQQTVVDQLGTSADKLTITAKEN